MSGSEMFAAQNRKLDILLAVVGLVAAHYLYTHGQHVVAYIVAGVVASELLQAWGGALGLVAAPVLLGKEVWMRLTRRQRRARTRYTVGGQEWYARPITRAVQETMASMLPDSALVDAATASPLAAFGFGVAEGEQPTAEELRAKWMASIDCSYQQLAYLLVAASNPDPDDPASHPDEHWLGNVCPVARAQHLLTEIQQRAAIEDVLPA